MSQLCVLNGLFFPYELSSERIKVYLRTHVKLS